MKEPAGYHLGKPVGPTCLLRLVPKPVKPQIFGRMGRRVKTVHSDQPDLFTEQET